MRAGYLRADVLHDVSLNVRPGEFVGLLGANGSGKSTLLRALVGVIPVRSGTVRILGDLLTTLHRREVARRVSVVPQNETALFEFTVRDVVLMGRSPWLPLLGGPGPTDMKIVNDAMAAVDVADLADKPVTELSGGERQRVRVARALAQQSPIMLLDEPTAHVDIAHQSALLVLIRELARRSNTAVLAALHDLNLAISFCDRVYVLRKGQVVSEGTPLQALTSESLENAYGAGVRIVPLGEPPGAVILPDI